MAPMLLIEASGSASAIGETIGQALRPILPEAVARHRRYLETQGIAWELALDIARRCRADLEEALPRTAEEMHAVARAAAIDVDALVSLNALQEILFLARRLPLAEGCTSLALPAATTTDGSILLAHNEDALPNRHEQVYVVRCRPAGEPAFVAFAYGGLFLYQGVNELGIGSTGNALLWNDIRIGVPKLFLYREVLRATSLAGAIRATMLPERANGNNHLIATAEGEIYDVEVSGRHAALQYIGNQPFAHTNHVLAPELRQIEEGDTLDSQLRRNRAQRLLELGIGQHSVETVKKILTDHANSPNSICKHLDPEGNGMTTRTIAALIVNVTEREIWVAAGQPCRQPFERFSLS
ncbi:C45 family autoproteolytic acyltransferase/hydrolase [Thermomicrobium sp. 4228-Ro]|uniref:C45 family autoproteolytic acyltransferase/hydolase n=1 Tax=Thermomicrobium sp. 4228-Ro TaxID=2993937 RepID=UPI0022495ACD|nr:C45 family peptidase [Thermomicrobium sp. 4228-Ro]MCX2726943.1 C45 family autoproteolytic acyltransferase/hydrolase [Thermomicrobium sp. 4228-Ro]